MNNKKYEKYTISHKHQNTALRFANWIIAVIADSLDRLLVLQMMYNVTYQVWSINREIVSIDLRTVNALEKIL